MSEQGMANVFASPKLTLQRARYHIDDFERVSKGFLSSHPWAEVIDKDSWSPLRTRFDRVEAVLKPSSRIFVCSYFDGQHDQAFEDFVAAYKQENGVAESDDLVAIHVTFQDRSVET